MAMLRSSRLPRIDVIHSLETRQFAVSVLVMDVTARVRSSVEATYLMAQLVDPGSRYPGCPGRPLRGSPVCKSVLQHN
jgi:hypothetical protein